MTHSQMTSTWSVTTFAHSLFALQMPVLLVLFLLVLSLALAAASADDQAAGTADPLPWILGSVLVGLVLVLAGLGYLWWARQPRFSDDSQLKSITPVLALPSLFNSTTAAFQPAMLDSKWQPQRKHHRQGGPNCRESNILHSHGVAILGDDTAMVKSIDARQQPRQVIALESSSRRFLPIDGSVRHSLVSETSSRGDLTSRGVELVHQTTTYLYDGGLDKGGAPSTTSVEAGTSLQV
ncbi:Aste57867_24029 [Aphanomyces stellatus]|uniref:Aste57867_24029 protein n=1 Tax=Aphanomyces stellatus TaxID=120398 RepID=A0A485LPE1_9STRA|nr:hypothetical protein As57867_023956 [Aphanomyces stellatus]VFU00672.1 Aste57867_24029 [Aphanomyces stellatus]